jgi:hypothetical protein
MGKHFLLAQAPDKERAMHFGKITSCPLNNLFRGQLGCSPQLYSASPQLYSSWTNTAVIIELLLHRHRLRQIPRLIYIAPACHGRMVRKQLQRDDCQQRAECL